MLDSSVAVAGDAETDAVVTDQALAAPHRIIVYGLVTSLAAFISFMEGKQNEHLDSPRN